VTRFFPSYGLIDPPPRAQQRVGTGGYTEYKGSGSDGGGSVRLSVIDSPHDAYTAYGQLEFGTGHADEDYTARIRTYQDTHTANGQYGQLQINPPIFINDGYTASWWAREYSDTGSPAYSKVFAASGVSDGNNTNPWEAITYWSRDSNIGGYIQHYAGGYYWYDNANSGSITTLLSLNSSGDLAVTGSISKGSGTFDIPHPVVEGKRLRHSFVEGPYADLIYRGTVTLEANPTVIDLDNEFNMTEGTWEALNHNPWSMAAASGEVVEWGLDGKQLTLSGDEGVVCNWMVIGERHDQHMLDHGSCNNEGRIILEYDQPSDTQPDMEL